MIELPFAMAVFEGGLLDVGQGSRAKNVYRNVYKILRITKD